MTVPRTVGPRLTVHLEGGALIKVFSSLTMVRVYVKPTPWVEGHRPLEAGERMRDCVMEILACDSNLVSIRNCGAEEPHLLSTETDRDVG